MPTNPTDIFFHGADEATGPDGWTEGEDRASDHFAPGLGNEDARLREVDQLSEQVSRIHRSRSPGRPNRAAAEREDRHCHSGRQHTREHFDDEMAIDEDTAGGLMNTEYVALPQNATVADALPAFYGFSECWFADRVAYEVERLTGLGARFVRHNQDPDDDYVVMTDPEGNEFCVCAVAEG